MLAMDDILFQIQGFVGSITLNRPTALNALNHQMIQALDTTLQQWESNPHLSAILLEGAGDKAFCAGGDIRSLYQASIAKDPTVFEFFWNEYRLNHRIACLKKPIISLLNGITMGGGVGISQHNGIRIATEKYLFAMPETGIGFFPDVGGSYFLPRIPHHVGIYLALTGARISASTAYALELVDFIVDSNALPLVKNALLEFPWHDRSASLLDALGPHLQEPTTFELQEHLSEIDHCFQADTVEDIMARLAARSSDFAKTTLNTLQKQSPTSLKVTLQQCQRGMHLSIAQCLQMEYRMVHRFIAAADFREGVRAAIIDKDRNPQWQPRELIDVTDSLVASYFAPLEKELQFN